MRYVVALLALGAMTGCFREFTQLSSPTAAAGSAIVFTPTIGFAAKDGFVPTRVRVGGVDLRDVRFSGSSQRVTSSCTSDDEIALEAQGQLLCVDVPADAQTGPLIATNNEGTDITSSQAFVLIGEPSIDALEPGRGFGALVPKPNTGSRKCVLTDVAEGDCLRVFALRGRNFDGQQPTNNKLTVNAAAATVIPELSNSGIITFDAGARTSVTRVLLETPSGSVEVEITDDQALGVPTLEGFAPLRALPSSPVLLRGSGFDDETHGNNTVSLEVTVAGTTFTKIALVTGVSAESLTFLIPTFSEAELPEGAKGFAQIVVTTPLGEGRTGTLEVMGPPMIRRVYADNDRVNELITERSRFPTSSVPMELRAGTLIDRGATEITSDIVTSYSGATCADTLPPMEKIASRIIVCGKNFDLTNSKLDVGGFTAEITGLSAGGDGNECFGDEQALVFGFPGDACDGATECAVQVTTLAGVADTELFVTQDLHMSPAVVLDYVVPKIAQPDQVVRLRGHNLIDHPKAQAVVVGEPGNERCALVLWVRGSTDLAFRVPRDAMAGEKIYLKKGKQKIDLGVTLSNKRGHLASDSVNVSTLVGDTTSAVPVPYQYRQHYSGGTAVSSDGSTAYTLLSTRNTTCNTGAGFDLYSVNVTAETATRVVQDVCEPRIMELSPSGAVLGAALPYAESGSLSVRFYNTTTWAPTTVNLAPLGATGRVTSLAPLDDDLWAVAFVDGTSSRVQIVNRATPATTNAVTANYALPQLIWESATKLWIAAESGAEAATLGSVFFYTIAGNVLTLAGPSGPTGVTNNSLFAISGNAIAQGTEGADSAVFLDDQIVTQVGSTTSVSSLNNILNYSDNARPSFRASISAGLTPQLSVLSFDGIVGPTSSGPPPVGPSDPIPIDYFTAVPPNRGSVHHVGIPLDLSMVDDESKAIFGLQMGRQRMAQEDGLRSTTMGKFGAVMRHRLTTDRSRLVQHVVASFQRGTVDAHAWTERVTGDAWVTNRGVSGTTLTPDGVSAIALAPNGTLFLASKDFMSNFRIYKRAAGAAIVTQVGPSGALGSSLSSGFAGTPAAESIEAMTVHPKDGRLYVMFKLTGATNKLYVRSLDPMTLATEAEAALLYDAPDLDTNFVDRTMSVLQGSDALYVAGFKFTDPSTDFWTLATVTRDAVANKITVTRRHEKDRVVQHFVDNTSLPAVTAYGKPGQNFERYQLVGSSPKPLLMDGGPSASGASPISRYLPYRGDTQGTVPLVAAAAHGRAVLEAPDQRDALSANGKFTWSYFATDFAGERMETQWAEVLSLTVFIDAENSEALLGVDCSTPAFAAPQLGYSLGCLSDPWENSGNRYEIAPLVVASPSGRRAYAFMDDSVAIPLLFNGNHRVCLYSINLDQGSLGLSRMNFCVGGTAANFRPTHIAMSPYGDELFVIDDNNKVQVIR